ncbi:MAG: hypothetical protein Q7V57_09430 [Actinomycetota bacterium]|nr:hypothetical protein [Actinomycetota bacterium]
MTIDLLLREAGEHVDRLAANQRSAVAVRPPAHKPTARLLAACALTVLVIGGLVALAMRPGPSVDPVSPTSSGPPSVFDSGADMIVFLKHGASPEQVAFVRDALTSQSDAIDPSRVEYLDVGASLLEARRVLASDAEFGALAPNVPTLFRLYAAPGATAAQLDELKPLFMLLPNVQDVRRPEDDQRADSVPMSPDTTDVATQPTLAPPSTS